MLKSELLRAIQQEIRRHDFSHFVEEPAIGRARRQGRRCTGLSGLQKADQYDEPISGSSDG
jgi:hypothetical protein